MTEGDVKQMAATVMRQCSDAEAAKSDDRTPARFDCWQVVPVPAEVNESRKAKIVGMEWGPDNLFLRGCRADGWVYWVRFVDGGKWFLVSEAELEAWSS